MNHLQQVVFCLWAILAVTLVIAATQIVKAAPPPGPIDPKIHEWFESQRVPDGTGRSCCSESDGHVIREEDWRIADGEYEVTIEGQWVRFANTGAGQPGNKVLGYTANPMGAPVAWYTLMRGEEGRLTVFPYCFAPGTVS